MHTQLTTDRTPGIHHITAIASDPQKNLDFYTRTLGLRLVKRTVNFDDPGSYHLYFGNELGSPGTILTFFPHPGARPGVQGVGYQTDTAFAIPTGSIAAWAKRLGDMGVRVIERDTRFGQPLLRFADHDGMQLELIETPHADHLLSWKDGPVGAEIAVRGFHSATLTLGELQETADVLQTLGFTQQQTEGSRTRFVAHPTASTHPGDLIANIIDIVVDPDGQPGRLGAGVVHHIALRANNDAQQARYHARLSAAGLGVSPVRDRNYFRSIYFRTPGGVLFEIATDAPGFAVDEPAPALGMGLKLPAEYEPLRSRLEGTLPPIHIPTTPGLATHHHRFDANPNSTGTLILLHGTGGDERSLLPLGRKIAPNANLLSPRGNALEGDQWRFFKRLRPGVFDQADLAVRVRELAQWLAAAGQRYAINPQATAYVGFSNGANLAAAMLLRGQAGGIKRAVLIRAMVPGDPMPGVDLRGVRVLMLSGKDDEMVPVENANRLAAMLTEAGATVDHHILDTGHGLVKTDVELAMAWLGKEIPAALPHAALA